MLDLVKMFAEPLDALAILRARQLDVASFGIIRNGRQRLVQFVSQPSREMAHRRDALRMSQLGGEPLHLELSLFPFARFVRSASSAAESSLVRSATRVSNSST